MRALTLFSAAPESTTAGDGRMRARAVASLVGYALVAGLIVAAAALPLAAVVGLATRSAGDAYLALPSTLVTPPSPQTTYVYASDGKTLITAFYDENRRNVSAGPGRRGDAAGDRGRRGRPLLPARRSRPQERVVRAVVSDGEQRRRRAGRVDADHAVRPQRAEDRSESHPAAADRRDLRHRRSASCRRRGTRSRSRQKLTKEEILDRYLNIAYFGDGAYGDLGGRADLLRQAAEPADPARGGAARRSRPVARHRQPGQRRQAGRDGPAHLRPRRDGPCRVRSPRPRPTRPTARRSSSAVHPQPERLCRRAGQAQRLGLLLRLPARSGGTTNPQFGATVADREQALKEGGYTIVTSLDPTAQATALVQSLYVYGYDNAALAADRGRPARYRTGAGDGGEPALQPRPESGRRIRSTRTRSTS